MWGNNLHDCILYAHFIEVIIYSCTCKVSTIAMECPPGRHIRVKEWGKSLLYSYNHALHSAVHLLRAVLHSMTIHTSFQSNAFVLVLSQNNVHLLYRDYYDDTFHGGKSSSDKVWQDYVYMYLLNLLQKKLCVTGSGIWRGDVWMPHCNPLHTTLRANTWAVSHMTIHFSLMFQCWPIQIRWRSFPRRSGCRLCCVGDSR